jgi:penicillin-insensitive murein endopeptidase
MAGGAAAGSDDPAPGPLHIVGGPDAGGRIAGAVSLLAQDPRFQTIHPDRSAFWGAPQPSLTWSSLAGRPRRGTADPLLMEYISRARGGSMPGGHVSH